MAAPKISQRPMGLHWGILKLPRPQDHFPQAAVILLLADGQALGVFKFLLQKFGSFSVTLLELEMGLYTSVENRMLCLLLSGAGIASSCRKYSST